MTNFWSEPLNDVRNSDTPPRKISNTISRAGSQVFISLDEIEMVEILFFLIPVTMNWRQYEVDYTVS